MAYRPDASEFDKPLTKSELAERYRQLALLNPSHVQEAYARAHKECEMRGDTLPRAAMLQELGCKNW